MSKLKQLGKDSVIYGAGGIISKGILFLLLPVYTRVFTPYQYGVIETINLLGIFLGIFLVMGSDAAQSFYFFEQEKHGKTAQIHLVSAILEWRIFSGIVLVILAIFLAFLSNKLFLTQKLNLGYLTAALFGVLLVQIMSQSAEVLRLLYKPFSNICINVAYVVISSFFSIIFAVLFGLGIMGYFLGFCLGGIIANIIGWWTVRDYLDLSELHIYMWPKIIKFGFPLIFGSMAMYVLNTTDRWFIIRYHGQESLGLYAVGSKFVVFLTLTVDAFRQAFSPMGMNAIHRDDGPDFFRAVSRIYLGLGAMSAVILTFLSPILLKVFTSLPYHSAYPIVGILSWSIVFYGFFMVVTPGIWKREKTAWSSISMLIAAFVNIILDFLFVPRFGGIGAAIATSISFFVWILATLIVSQMLWAVNYPLKILTLQICLGVLGCWWILYIYWQMLGIWQAGIVAFIFSGILIFTVLGDNRLKGLSGIIKMRLNG